MPYLIKKLEGEILSNLEGVTSIVSKISGDIGDEDYVNIHSFISFNQNFTQVIGAIEIPLLENFGLKNNTQFIELKINY